MPYFVRKLNNRQNVNNIGLSPKICDMFADAVTAEFRTKDGALSVWKIDNLNELNEAVLAIAVTSSKIDRMDFIVINSDYLFEQDLECKKTYAGQDIAVCDLQDTHYDIKNITISKLINCAYLYKKIFFDDNNQEKYIVRYAEGEIKDILKKAQEKSRIDISKLNNNLQKYLLSVSC